MSKRPGSAESSQAEPSQPNAGTLTYRIDELAELTGITVRNIREYQDRGLLDPPQRVGRFALYAQEHIVRLRLIDRLLKRGYTMMVIRDLIEAWAAGRDLNDVLGFETVVSKPWTDEKPARVSLLKLRRIFGRQLTPTIIRRAVQLGVVRPAGVRAFEVPSPALVRAGGDLVAAGIPLRVVIDVIEHVQEELDLPADRLVGMVFERIVSVGGAGGLPTGDDMHKLTETVERLRPHAIRAIEALAAQSLTRAVDRRFAELTQHVVSQPENAADYLVSSARQARIISESTTSNPPAAQ